ncbi:hypothetical protein TYRP_022033 [Tyrophagus putrescentiae]|nr:hypothetical protein TYRP_022033 [Tyrophagus putrescentiae]
MVEPDSRNLEQPHQPSGTLATGVTSPAQPDARNLSTFTAKPDTRTGVISPASQPPLMHRSGSTGQEGDHRPEEEVNQTGTQKVSHLQRQHHHHQQQTLHQGTASTSSDQLLQASNPSSTPVPRPTSSRHHLNSSAPSSSTGRQINAAKATSSTHGDRTHPQPQPETFSSSRTPRIPALERTFVPLRSCTTS